MYIIAKTLVNYSIIIGGIDQLHAPPHGWCEITAKNGLLNPITNSTIGYIYTVRMATLCTLFNHACMFYIIWQCVIKLISETQSSETV